MDYIIDFKEIVEQAPAEEPARQYYFMDRVRELVEMKKQEGYAAHCMVEVMGCQMSAKDGEKLLGILERCGYTVTEDDRDADVVLFTTCTVRENANMKLYGRVGRLKHQYERREGMIIGITGCMMQEKDEVEGIRKRYPYVRTMSTSSRSFCTRRSSPGSGPSRCSRIRSSSSRSCRVTVATASRAR